MNNTGLRAARLGLLLGAALALAGQAQAASYGLAQPRLEVVAGADLRAEAGELRAQLEGERLPAPNLQAPAGRGSVAVQPMFSSQQGSWPFEPFVNDGLFRAIAGYQAHHPQALVLSGGSLTLEQLAASVNDPRILRRHKDGYLLSYPLVIGPGAALLVQGQTLYLYTYSGTAIINQGLLSLEKAGVESWNGDKPQSTDRPYRPFIMAWAGSRVRVEDSTLRRLGYNANLTRGLTTARSTQQAATVAPAQVLVRNSRFEDLSSGLELQAALARVEGNRFSAMQQYAVDLRDSRAEVRDNRIDGVENNSGIRVRGSFAGRLADNRILRTAKAGIEVNGFSGRLAINHNVLGESRGNAIQLRDIASAADTRLLLDGNLIGNSQGSAIDAAGVASAYLLDNRIGGSPEYAISVRNPTRLAGRLVLTGNRLDGIGKALVRVEGVDEVVLGGNSYQGNPPLQNILIGDLLPVQSQLLDSTVRNACFVRIATGGSPGAAQPTPDCRGS